ncbi:MAG: methionine adenosyltransferase [Candidatus Diapherotrites archaeon]|uniref:Methionine adenosyltransferase n=1 Tax=Candidatus Iainarchaeum sp. TaxID=3101447 RepID=A0A8T4LFG7_9ARCH|nr:methionine adenosyltransferase [Candidatus Diapherotrites archaeon]
MKKGNYLFSSESVTEGHPDKVADQISDAILDACLAQDPNSHTGIETLVTTNLCILAGEINTKAKVDFQNVAREKIREIGYVYPEIGFDFKNAAVLSAIHSQSPDIAQGVNEGEGEFKEQGAGDQGLMFGFACNETPEFLPLTIVLAHRLTMRLSEVRKKNIVSGLFPDGKSQVTVEYENGKAKRLETVVIAAHHSENVSVEELREQILEHVIRPVCGKWLDAKTKLFINSTGRFVLGGPTADTGLTGRKIIVDSYGGHSAHGGGAFSGKCPTKVDRSAAYMARYIAKNIVAAGLAEQCEIQLAYAIGVAEPVSVLVHTEGTAKVSEEVIEHAVREVFHLKPADIIKELDLLRPIYAKTAAYGHFGRNDPDFSWEKTDKAALLASKAGIKAPAVAGF